MSVKLTDHRGRFVHVSPSGAGAALGTSAGPQGAGALDVNVVNPLNVKVALSGDIEIGAVELKDGGTNARQRVASATSAAHIHVINSSGNIVDSFGTDPVGIKVGTSSLSTTNPIPIMPPAIGYHKVVIQGADTKQAKVDSATSAVHTYNKYLNGAATSALQNTQLNRDTSAVVELKGINAKLKSDTSGVVTALQTSLRGWPNDIRNVYTGTAKTMFAKLTDGSIDLSFKAANTAPSTSTNVVPVQNVDEHGRSQYYDEVDNATVVIDLPHHKIHEGEHYTFSNYDSDVDTASPKYWRITTPNTTKRIHWEAVMATTESGLVELYENPTINAAGTAGTIYNNERNSANTATATVFYDTTTTSDGTLIDNVVIGSGAGPQSVGGEARTDAEWILKQNEDYIIKFTPFNDNAKVSLTMLWYEV